MLIRFDRANPVAPGLAVKPHMKLNQGFLKAQARFNGEFASRSKNRNSKRNMKHKTCFSCRQKGHFGKDCPNGDVSKLKTVNNDHIQLRTIPSDSYASNETSSPRINIKAIWVPKALLSNRGGPNMCWVPKSA